MFKGVSKKSSKEWLQDCQTCFVVRPKTLNLFQFPKEKVKVWGDHTLSALKQEKKSGSSV